MNENELVPTLKSERDWVDKTEHGNYGIYEKVDCYWGSYNSLIEEHGTYVTPAAAYAKMKKLRLNTKSTSEKLNEKLTKLFGL